MPAIPNTIGVSGPFAPLDDADTYATIHEKYVQGMYRTVADVTERNAITQLRRKEGMLVYVVSEDTTYRLGSGLLDGDWSVARFGALSFSTIALLRAAIPYEGAVATVTGYYAANDGGGGLFYYSGASVVADDNGGFIKPTSYNGRWIRLVQNSVNPRQWGCKGDFLTGGIGGASSGTDDTAAFQAMFDYARVYGHNITGYPGNYRLTNTITIPTTFGGVVDFGVRTGTATKAMWIYMDANAKALFELTKPSGQTWLNITCYWRPQSGWNVAFNDQSPQVDPLSYMFYVKGWGKYLTIQRCDAWHCAGLISSVAIGIGSGTDQAALFDNTVSDCICYFGYRGLNLDYGSGSRWARLRFQTSPGNANGEPGDPPSYHAEYAIYIGASGGPGMNNEYFNNINIEWCSFTKHMIYQVGSEINWDTVHVEGINIPYNASIGSIRSLIYQNGGISNWNVMRIQDIHVAWGLNRLFQLFEFFGSPNTFFRLNSSIFDSFNSNSDDNVGGHTGGYYRMHRYGDTGGGASFMEVDNVNDASVRWESDSPSWYGHDPRCLPPSKRFELRSDFADGLSQWDTYYSGSPTEIAYGGESGSVGVATLSSGTSNTDGTLLILPRAPIYVTKGVYRFMFRFKLSAMAAGAGDSYSVKIGFMSDLSAGISGTPADGLFFETQYSLGSDDRFYLNATKNGVGTVREDWIIANDPETDVELAVKDTEANQWYDGELVINGDGTQVRLFDNPRKSATWANATTMIPLSTTPLYPQVLITKIGAGSNVTLKLDYLYLTFAPNGVY